MDTAKPNENMFNWGAAFVITPKVKLTTSIVQIALMDMARPALNMEPENMTNSLIPYNGKASPIGRALKLSSNNLKKIKWPSTLKKTKVHSTVKNWPTTGELVPDTGSTKEAKPKPVCIATAWPAIIKACEIKSVHKPKANPIKHSFIVTIMPYTVKGSVLGARLGIDGSIQTVIVRANRARVIIGKEFPETANIVAKKALIRHSGQTNWATAVRVIGSSTSINLQPVGLNQ